LLGTRERSPDIREKLDERLLVGDGAVDTLLADRGVAQPYNRANLAHLQLVRALHERPQCHVWPGTL
jgi:methionine synthase I (cobalamin-dependent)